MNFFSWLWSKISSAFLVFVKSAVDQLTQNLVVALKDFAVSVVTELATADLSNADKRKAAFDKIKAEAVAKGIEYRDSSINLLIELAVAQLKNEKK